MRKVTEASSSLRGDAEMLDVGSGEGRDFLPPVVGRQDTNPRGGRDCRRRCARGLLRRESRSDRIRLRSRSGSSSSTAACGKQIEDGAVGAGDGGVKLPAGENGDSAGADGGFDDFFGAGDALAGEPRVNRAEQMIADRSFGERQQERFVHGIGGTLRSGIEAADRFDFVAEELDADRALGFGRIDIENAAAQGVLSGHFDDVGGLVADGVQVGEKIVDVEGFAAAQNAGEIGVVVGRAQQDGRRGDRSDHDRGLAGGDLPEGGRAFFLEFGMREKDSGTGARRGRGGRRRLRDRWRW